MGGLTSDERIPSATCYEADARDPWISISLLFSFCRGVIPSVIKAVSILDAAAPIRLPVYFILFTLVRFFLSGSFRHSSVIAFKSKTGVYLLTPQEVEQVLDAYKCTA